ncbi:MAG: chemotaxis protein CheW [Chitinispirillaceae bacterium]|nr:chemotaxis protein CheW [Chitinispirillaceae bacterium]
MSSRQIVTFLLDDVVYGFDIRIIKEITPSVPITPVPLIRHEISGIVTIRGLVVLVMDIAVILGGNKQSIRSMAQIMIVKTTRELGTVTDFRPSFDAEVLGDKPVGFLFDAVGDILSVETSAIEGTPSHLKEHNRHYMEGVINLKSQPVILLNAGKLISIDTTVS